MDSSGTGRWDGYQKKTTVEDCLVLSASQLRRRGILRGNAELGGNCYLRRPLYGRYDLRILYWIDTRAGRTGVLCLRYSHPESGRCYKYNIRLATSIPNFGGLRWWFICPLVKNGAICGRRASKLYMPPHSVFFGCRRCYDLTYESCQSQHIWRRMRRSWWRKG